MMTKEAAEAAAEALLAAEPRFSDSWIGRIGKLLRTSGYFIPTNICSSSSNNGILGSIDTMSPAKSFMQSFDSTPSPSRWSNPATAEWHALHPLTSRMDNYSQGASSFSEWNTSSSRSSCFSNSIWSNSSYQDWHNTYRHSSSFDCD